GGVGASLLLPAMQSLIHGNFEGPAQRKVYALVGAAAAIAAAVGPLLGGFITTYLSWRVGFGLGSVIIAIVLSGAGPIRDVPCAGRSSATVCRRGPGSRGGPSACQGRPCLRGRRRGADARAASSGWGSCAWWWGWAR